MKSVLISIQPKWVEKIANGEKTVEVRKTRPKLETPFKCYIYCTQSRYPKQALFIKKGKLGGYWANEEVIGEFVCDKIEMSFHDLLYHPFYDLKRNMLQKTCLNYEEIRQYGNEKDLYLWHISDLVIYDKPKELSEFEVVDIQEVRNCDFREQTYIQNDNGGNIKNGMMCTYTMDWCTNCRLKPLIRPPQSWCYVEV